MTSKNITLLYIINSHFVNHIFVIDLI